MAFLETPTFPDVIAAWAEGGMGFRTTAVEVYGGFEYRNAAWSQARGEWSIAEALRSGNVDSAFALKILRNLQRESLGMFGGFRFRNMAEQDYADQGQGTVLQLDSTHWQMYKNYPTTPAGSNTYRQIIQKPRTPIVVTGGGSYTTNLTTGVITKSGGADPTGWTGEYDYPCRFNMDLPRFGLIGNGAFFNWADLRIIQIRLPQASS
jgi:uncharacterized protein (TIGR02217 family)